MRNQHNCHEAVLFRHKIDKSVYLECIHALLRCIGLWLNCLYTLDLLKVNWSSQTFSLLLNRWGNSQVTLDKRGCTVLLRLEVNINPTQMWCCLNDGFLPYPFVRIKIIVGYFFLVENEPSLLVVQRGGLLLLLRSFNEDFFQYVIWHDSVRIYLQETRDQEVMNTFVKPNSSIIPGLFYLWQSNTKQHICTSV